MPRRNPSIHTKHGKLMFGTRTMRDAAASPYYDELEENVMIFGPFGDAGKLFGFVRRTC